MTQTHIVFVEGIFNFGTLMGKRTHTMDSRYTN